MKDIKYRGWIISKWKKPIPIRSMDYDYAHEEYDGPEDRRIGNAESVQACRDAIDEFIEDETG